MRKKGFGLNGYLAIGIMAAVTMMHEVIAVPINTVDWGDPQLAKCIHKLASKNSWQNTEDITDIKCHSKGIGSAQSLSKLKNLRKLSLFNNQIQQLDLSNLSQLEFLNLANNDLKKLQINGLSDLQKLYLFRNELQTVDLQGLTALEEIRIMQNKLNKLDITPLGSLKQGHIFDNQLEDLKIDGLHQLEFLDVRQNPMPDELYDFYDEQEGIVISHDGNAEDWK